MPSTPFVRRHVAPTGQLRAVINLGNPVLAQGDSRAPRGVSVAIAGKLARWLDVALELNCVDNARDAYAAIAAGRVDLCFLAIEPERELAVAFTGPYVLIEGVHVVDEESPLTSSDEVDRPGHRVSVREGSAYDLFLNRTVQHAELVRMDDPTRLLDSGTGVRVAAGVRQPMTVHAAATGRRVLEPAFMQIRQAVGLPRTTDADAVRAVAGHVEELVSNGFVSAALVESGVEATVPDAMPPSP